MKINNILFQNKQFCQEYLTKYINVTVRHDRTSRQGEQLAPGCGHKDMMMMMFNLKSLACRWW